MPPAGGAALQAPLSRRRAVAQDLQRERNRLEKADATDTPALIRHSIGFLEKQLAKLQQDIDSHINNHPGLKEDRELLTRIPATSR
ncbi:MAG: hypothetical protein WAW36_04265 [Methylovulum miyakonense]|uniref:hypothetical protein n=1 Tax=Methylovulum miyakonense TaxID=645578 RepID=UPI003BB514A0